MKTNNRPSKNVVDIRGKEKEYNRTQERFDRVRNFESAATSARKQMKDEPNDLETDAINYMRGITGNRPEVALEKSLEVKNKKLNAGPVKHFEMKPYKKNSSPK